VDRWFSVNILEVAQAPTGVSLEGLPSLGVRRLARYRRRQRRESNPLFQEKIKQKLQAVRGQRYIQRGLVQSLTSYFAVPKGETDVRIETTYHNQVLTSAYGPRHSTYLRWRRILGLQWKGLGWETWTWVKCF